MKPIKLPTLLTEARYAVEDFEETVERKATAYERRIIIREAWAKVREMREAYREWQQMPPCECGLDDVTVETCPRHKHLAGR